MTDVPKDIMEAAKRAYCEGCNYPPEWKVAEGGLVTAIARALHAERERRTSSPGWPDPLESPQAEAIRSGKIDDVEIRNLFDQMEREIQVHRKAFCERRTPAVVTWQPIETAPKDGTIIIGRTTPDDVFACAWFWDDESRTTGDWLMYGTDVIKPSEWVHTPAVPSLSSGAGEAENA